LALSESTQDLQFHNDARRKARPTAAPVGQEVVQEPAERHRIVPAPG
jgi:hypothetical protein